MQPILLHAATSHGFVTNDGDPGYSKWLAADDGSTIFNRLEEAGVSWRVYYDDDQLISLTAFFTPRTSRGTGSPNFRGMAQFHEDVASGTLPAYSFIEPRMILQPQRHCIRPSACSRNRRGRDPRLRQRACRDVRAGEALLSDIYMSIKASRSPHGSNAINTALVVVFDEHGGTYDHVPPPRAVPRPASPSRARWGTPSTASDAAFPRWSSPPTRNAERSSTRPCTTTRSSDAERAARFAAPDVTATRPRPRSPMRSP
ncbi:MAG: alkaline phosphatase family protein [Galbitalea sp.]